MNGNNICSFLMMATVIFTMCFSDLNILAIDSSFMNFKEQVDWTSVIPRTFAENIDVQGFWRKSAAVLTN